MVDVGEITDDCVTAFCCVSAAGCQSFHREEATSSYVFQLKTCDCIVITTDCQLVERWLNQIDIP